MSEFDRVKLEVTELRKLVNECMGRIQQLETPLLFNMDDLYRSIETGRVLKP